MNNVIPALAFTVTGCTVAIGSPGAISYLVLVVCLALAVINLGWLPSNSYTVHRQVEVNGSCEDVFWYLADFRNASEWDPNVTFSARHTQRLTSRDEPRRGDIFMLTTLWKGQQSEMRYELMDVSSRPKADGARSFELRGQAGSVVAHDQVRVAPTAKAASQRPMARVSYTLTVTILGWKGCLIRLIARDLEALATESIGGLVKTCEAKWHVASGASAPSAGKRRRNSRGQ